MDIPCHWETMPGVAVGTTVPVMWPTGYTGLRLARGEVEVLDEAGKVVATTGKRYDIAERPAEVSLREGLPDAPPRSPMPLPRALDRATVVPWTTRRSTLRWIPRTLPSG
jgi:hypothetical protein